MAEPKPSTDPAPHCGAAFWPDAKSVGRYFMAMRDQVMAGGGGTEGPPGPQGEQGEPGPRRQGQRGRRGTLARRVRQERQGQRVPQAQRDHKATLAPQVRQARHRQPGTGRVIQGPAGVPSYTDSPFTATITGMSTSLTVTARYVQIGKQVTLTLPGDATRTSNATTMTITGIPAGIVPGHEVCAAFRAADNNVFRAARPVFSSGELAPRRSICTKSGSGDRGRQAVSRALERLR